jgi:protein TonB
MKEELGFGNIWSQHRAAMPRFLSVLLHATLVFVLLIPQAPTLRPLPMGIVNIAFAEHLVAPVIEKDSGGGGGGRHAPTPASLGRLPKPSDRQLVPPDPEPPKNIDPTVVVEATIVAPNLPLPQLNLVSLGDPEGIPGPPSPGPGNGYGIGTGDGHGVGPGDGPGTGEGEGGNFGGGKLGIKGALKNPVLVKQILPEYSEEARKARFQGSVILDTIIREDGSVQIDRIARGLGFGLDEKAIEAVLQWKFEPGRINGKPVPMHLYVEVNFNLR